MKKLMQAAQVMTINIQHTVNEICGSNKNPTNTKNVKNQWPEIYEDEGV
jgi:hypothetical protein